MREKITKWYLTFDEEKKKKGTLQHWYTMEKMNTTTCVCAIRAVFFADTVLQLCIHVHVERAWRSRCGERMKE